MGARFEPHEYPYIRVSVAATLQAEGRRAPDRFGQARVGLPLEYVGGVLAGALQEPNTVGPGTLIFDHAAVHEVDSSWEAFHILAIGVVRLLGLPSGTTIPMDLLPNFGGSSPASPGRLRLTHLAPPTEAALGDLADERALHSRMLMRPVA